MKYFNSNAVFQIFITTLGTKVLQGFNFVYWSYIDSVLTILIYNVCSMCPCIDKSHSV